MLTITKPSENRVDLELNGSIDADTMRAGLDDLLSKSEDVSQGVMLYRIDELALPTLGALGVELGRLPELFGLLGKFDRCAVLSDAAWIRTAAEIKGALFPGIEIKSFTPDHHADAEAWLTQSADAPA